MALNTKGFYNDLYLIVTTSSFASGAILNHFYLHMTMYVNFHFVRLRGLLYKITDIKK